MMNTAFLAVCAILIIGGVAQRSPYAGKDPVGYPAYLPTEDTLGNRFGEVDATTIKLPIEALGDAELVKRLLKLPVDKQPFWLTNWQALEANRAKPQTFAQRENSFIDNNGVKQG